MTAEVAPPAGSPALQEPGRRPDSALRGPAISLESLSVAYGSTPVLEGVDLAVEPGELLALIGRSGSGKSTLLRCVAGFVAPSAGVVRIGTEEVSTPSHSLPPERRFVGFVFQSHALWPHMSALDNVAYPWKVRGVPAGERRAKAAALLERVGLGRLGGRRPAELSGGERQRVALARALAGEPQILLLDEPFSSVDVLARDELLELVRRLVESSGLTTIFTTHDQHEATALADRAAVLVDGRVAQVGTPRRLYEQPVSSFVARFMGACNLVAVRVVSRAAGCCSVRPSTGAGSLGAEAGAASAQLFDLPLPAPDGDEAIVVIRPEDLEVLPATATRAPWRGRVLRVNELGGSTELRIAAAGLEWKVLEPAGRDWQPGHEVTLRARRALFLPAELNGSS